MNPARGRLWDLAGVAGPAALAIAIAVVSSRRPDYSNLVDTLSELGRLGRSDARWMNLCGFMLSGLLTMLAARSVYRAFGAGMLSIAGAVLLTFGGAFLAGLGAFPMDERSPREVRELGNNLHVICAFLAYACLALAPLLFGLHALRIPPLHFWAGVSLAACVGVLAFGLPFFSSEVAYRGACQRASLAAHYAWLAAVCVRRFVGQQGR